MMDEFDVERYAAFLAGDPKAIKEYDLSVARTVLEAVDADFRLLPRGGILRTEYGRTIIGDDGPPSGWNRMVVLGTGDFAKQHGTHKRFVHVWPSYSPNDYWARYTTAWVPVEE